MTTPRRHAITLIPGDGVGPEVALATKRVLDAAAATAGVAFDWEEAEAGAEVFKKGDTSGVPKATRDSIERGETSHLSFGGGIHFCIGAPLARLELELLFGALAEALPEITLLPGAVRRPGFQFRGYVNLPIAAPSASR